MVGGLIIALAFIIYLFTIVRGGDTKNSLAGDVVRGTFTSIMKTLKFIGVAITKIFKVLLKTTVLIFATMRDFFKSKI